MIHLDTSFLILALARGTPQDEVLRGWLQSGTALGISSVAWGEFLCGPLSEEDSAGAAKIVPEPVPFTAREAAEAARLFNVAGRRRGSFGDCMIAATALIAAAPLITANEDDFDDFAAQGLTVLTAERVRAKSGSDEDTAEQ